MLEQRTSTKAYFETTALAWRDIYAKTDLYSHLYRQRRSIVLARVDELGVPDQSRVLEIGCGPGLTTVALAERGYSVLAVDTAVNMIAMTRALASESGVGRVVSTTLCDASRLGVRDETFDLVVVVGVTEWIQSLPKAMREFARVLKPGGHVIVTGDNSWALHCVLDPVLNPLLAPVKRGFKRICKALGLRATRPDCYLRSLRVLQSSLESEGLKSTKATTFGFGPFSIFKKKPLPDHLGFKLHRWLQNMADRGLPVLRWMGHVNVISALKPHPPRYRRSFP